MRRVPTPQSPPASRLGFVFALNPNALERRRVARVVGGGVGEPDDEAEHRHHRHHLDPRLHLRHQVRELSVSDSLRMNFHLRVSAKCSADVTRTRST